MQSDTESLGYWPSVNEKGLKYKDMDGTGLSQQFTGLTTDEHEAKAFFDRLYSDNKRR